MQLYKADQEILGYMQARAPSLALNLLACVPGFRFIFFALRLTARAPSLALNLLACVPGNSLPSLPSISRACL